jgi:hypothetical protein
VCDVWYGEGERRGFDDMEIDTRAVSHGGIRGLLLSVSHFTELCATCEELCRVVLTSRYMMVKSSLHASPRHESALRTMFAQP